MNRKDQSGSTLFIVVVSLLGIGLLASGGFGFWAYSGRQDYKDNVDLKVAAAVKIAKEDQAVELTKKFEDLAKSPYKTYQSPATAGSVTFTYPKTWSAYVDEPNASQPINGYFHPNQVPGTNSGTSYALRVEMLGSDYSQIIKSYESLVKKGDLIASPYIPPKMVGVPNAQLGTRFDGLMSQNKSGSVVILKVRDKTLKIYTEATDFMADFNNNVLPSLVYIP